MEITHTEEKYIFQGKAKTFTIVLMVLGILSLAYGLFDLMGHEGGHAANRVWGNLLINGYFFFAIALGATFFMAVQYAAEAGWPWVIKRIMEAISSYLGIGALVLVIVFIGGTMHWHHLYHWMDPAVSDPESPLFDELIAHKTPFLNQTVFWVLTILFLGVWVWAQRGFRKRSLKEDKEGGLSVHKKNFTAAAAFLVFFGYSSMVASWLWIMSIDTHWFSTIFGWYLFSGMWLTAMVAMALITVWLKRLGHLKMVNESHIQDLGKWIFATSFLWSYLWFAQFMLIWYSNIPEEVTYYVARIQDYKVLFFGMFFVNFAFPMLVLMDKDAKRNPLWLTIIGCLVFVGHWVDAYLLVTPGTMQSHGHIGFLEIGMFLVFLGLFIFVVLSSLAKAPLVVKNNPYLDESYHFHQ
jgi:MFS family permease